jgi:hypothetical protein
MLVVDIYMAGRSGIGNLALEIRDYYPALQIATGAKKQGFGAIIEGFSIEGVFRFFGLSGDKRRELAIPKGVLPTLKEHRDE